MDRQTESSGSKSISPHTLIPAERTGGRRNAGRFYLAAAALMVGVVIAFIWMSQSRLAEIDLPADDAVQRPAALATVPQPLVAEPQPPEPIDAPAQNETVDTAADKTSDIAQAQPDDAPPAAAASSADSPRTPTRTPTTIPFVDSTEAVAGLGGATLWNANGSPAGYLVQGSLISARQRSADGTWIFGESESGNAGWMAADDLIIFDLERLAPQEVVIIPMTPTPASTSVMTSDRAPTASEPLPTVTPSGNEPVSPLSTKLATARIKLDDSRLNVRAGPGSSFKVIAKAFPKELYAILAISKNGEWLQLELPDIVGGFGWAAVEFLETEANLADLSVSDAVSTAPAFSSDVSENDAAPAAAPIENLVQHESGLPPMRIGPPPLGDSVAAQNLDSVTGLSGKLVIQQEWGGNIYVYDLDTGELRLLTGGFDPSISADGTQVAFTREGGENGVYTIDIDGGQETLLFSGREHLRSPKFSPDGQFIVFERGDESILCKDKEWRCRLSVPSPDGDLPEREIQPSLARIRVDGSDYWDPMDLQYARVPDWNEGGIVYQSLAGLQITQNKPNVDTESVYFDILKQYEMDPDWQPGSGIIAFQRREISHWEIFGVNADGSNLHALTRPGSALAQSLPSNVSPAWSPDGKYIVFLSNRTPDNTAGEWGIWVMDADGSNQRRLPIELPIVYTYVAEQMLDWGP